jgi:hypothetical protein
MGMQYFSCFKHKIWAAAARLRKSCVLSSFAPTPQVVPLGAKSRGSAGPRQATGGHVEAARPPAGDGQAAAAADKGEPPLACYAPGVCTGLSRPDADHGLPCVVHRWWSRWWGRSSSRMTRGSTRRRSCSSRRCWSTASRAPTPRWVEAPGYTMDQGSHGC